MLQQTRCLVTLANSALTIIEYVGHTQKTSCFYKKVHGLSGGWSSDNTVTDWMASILNRYQ